jgi:hypothetical protein
MPFIITSRFDGAIVLGSVRDNLPVKTVAIPYIFTARFADPSFQVACAAISSSEAIATPLFLTTHFVETVAMDGRVFFVYQAMQRYYFFFNN